MSTFYLTGLVRTPGAVEATTILLNTYRTGILGSHIFFHLSNIMSTDFPGTIKQTPSHLTTEVLGIITYD